MLNALAAAKIQRRRSRNMAASATRCCPRTGVAGARRDTQIQSGIQASPSTPVTTNAWRHPLRNAIQVATSGAITEPRLTPAWLTALPSALSPGRRYWWIAFPAAGMPAASAAPSTARQPTSPPSPLVKPVTMPAQDHNPTAKLMARFSPIRSISNPANGALAA